jgi:hypothetical protein
VSGVVTSGTIKVWQAGRMVFVRRLGFAQRVIILIGLGLAMAALGGYIGTLGSQGGNFGWFGYAPLTNSVFQPGADLSTWEQLLVWLALIALWTLAGLWLLAQPYEPDDDGSE